jgi:hypothetical protein
MVRCLTYILFSVHHARHEPELADRLRDSSPATSLAESSITVEIVADWIKED